MKFIFSIQFLAIFLMSFNLLGFVQPKIASQKLNPETEGAIDDYVLEQMRKLKIPGLALAIIKDDQIEYMQAYGIAGADGTNVTPQTPFLIGGLTKTFTALAIMQLVEEGKLDLDAPVQQYLPWFRVADAEASSSMRVRNLLNHTAGFSEVSGYVRNYDPNMNEDALEANVRKLDTSQLNNSPGSEYEYSNINYGILGLLIESVSGQSFEAYVQQNIFEPLDMQNSYTSQPEARNGGAANGYYPLFGLPIVFDSLMPYSRVILPTGGLYSSAEDMAHYLIALLNQGQYGDKTILSQKGVAELFNPGVEINPRDSFAMGWWVVPFYDSITHENVNGRTNYNLDSAITFSGAWDGFHSFALLNPQKQTALVVLMNTQDPMKSSAFGLLGWYIAALALGSEPSNYTPSEEFIQRNARLVSFFIVVLLAVEFVWFIFKWRSYRRESYRNVPSQKRLWIYMVLLAGIDVSLVWYFLSMMPRFNLTIGILVRSTPDLGMLMALILLLTIGWGVVRTILILRIIFRKTESNNSLSQSESPSSA